MGKSAAFSSRAMDKIAYVLAISEPEDTAINHGDWDALVARFSYMLEQDNPRFDRDLFRNACRFDYWKNKREPYKN